MRIFAAFTLVVALGAAGWWWRNGASTPEPTSTERQATPTSGSTAAPPNAAWAQLFEDLATEWDAKGEKR